MTAPAHVNIIYNGTLPAARGKIAQHIMQETPDQQRQRALDITNFLASGNNRNLLTCNADTQTVHTFVMGIAGTKSLKLVYGLGYGASGIGTTSPLDNKILLLTGEGGGTMGPPTSLVLPSSTLDNHQVPTMTEQQLLTKMQTLGVDYSWPVLARTHITDTSNTFHIVPCPAYLVCDGFDGDIDAFELYERILGLDDSTGTVFANLKQFIRAFLSASNATDNKPTPTLTDLLAPVSEPAKKWAESKYKSLFPTLVQTEQPPPLPPPGVPGAPNGHPPGFAAFWAAMMAQMNMNNGGPLGGPPGGVAEEKKDDTPDDTMGIAQLELNALRDMCGLRNSDGNDQLPKWIQDISEKGMTEAFKIQVVRKHIHDNLFYWDAEVIPTNLLLKMAVKRNWVGKDGNAIRPSLIHAADGLSPFAVADFNDDEVAAINDLEDSVTLATATSVADHQKLKKLMKVQVPSNSEDFTLMIRRYANLIFALFGPKCHLFLQLKTVIDAFRGYSRQVLSAMPQHTRGSILWIILLQSRHFALGNTDVIAAFAALQSKLQSKDGYINHMEVPLALYEDTTNKKRPPPGAEDPEDKDPKKVKVQNKNKWHPDLQKALFPALKKANFPSYSKIMKFCGADINVPFHQKDKTCAPNAFFGRCSAGVNCKKSHAPISDDKAKEILKIVDKFIKDPDGCANSKS